MINNYPYLNDKQFLNQLYHLKVSTRFAKIILLDWDENPIQEIQTRVLSGSFSLDGNSTVRRTGNLSLLIDGYQDLRHLKLSFSINKKISAEIGIKNTTGLYTDYPICWFPMGIYVINSISFNHSVGNLIMNIQIQDKMCLLNGDCGGTISSATVFDNYDTVDEEGNNIVSRPTIYQIITQLVNHFGGQSLDKIIISDLDTTVKQVMKWTGSSPLYFVKSQNEQYQMTTNADQYQEWLQNGYRDVEGSPFEYGRDIGFIYTDFTYPGQLICNAGSAVTNVLDDIIGVLSNYEYFYDVNGNFRFQEIKNYLNNSQTKYVIEDLINGYPNYVLDISRGKSVFEFNDSTLISSYNNNPQFSMIKNDFVIWGERQSVEGINIPIRYHLAIDKKPEIGNTYYAFSYVDPQDEIKKWHCPIKFADKTRFPEIGANGVFYLDQNENKIYTWGDNGLGKNDYIQIEATIERITTKDWRSQLYFQGVAAEPFGTDSNYYYTELKNEWPKIYDIQPDVLQNGQWNNYSQFKESTIKNAEGIDYFLDFIDSDSAISQFAIDNIGRRSYVSVEQKNINCVFEPNIPDIVLIRQSDSGPESDTEMSKIRQKCITRNQEYFQVPDSIYSALATGGMLNSGYNYIRQLLHQYTSYNENISISCLPIYTLQPNTRVFVQDNDSGIYGDYMINSINLSLDASGQMSISAIKALEKI